MAGDFSKGTLVRIAAPAGRLIGLQQGKVCSFKGIPYALPPVGALRWRPPQRLPCWDGARPALEPGPAPIQALPPRSALLYRLNNDDARALVMSEDCLYLSVWSPSPVIDARLPVLVWIHGGAYKTGHGAQDLFDGRRLAARGMVVVTLNMRLGALGFLSLPELAAEDPLGASGNYGIQDVVAALEWVQENIAAFGGDPARVTIAGNSAGAATVTHLMAAPMARGLFGAAIGQSLSGIFRSPQAMPTHELAARAGRAAMASLGQTLQQLRELSAAAFLDIEPQGVVVDGRVLHEDSADVFVEGRQAPIPLLAGWNSDEGSLYASPAAVDGILSAARKAQNGDAFDRFYPHAAETTWSPDRRALVGDRQFAYPVWRWARTHAETSAAPAWLYRFEHRLPLPEDLPPPSDGGSDFGAFHTAELPYTWDNLAARPWSWTEADQGLATQLADTWYRFAASGEPNGGTLPTWPQLDATGETCLMVFGEHAKPAAGKGAQAFELFDGLVYPWNSQQHEALRLKRKA